MFGDQSIIFRFRGVFGVPVEISSTLAMLVVLFVVLSGAQIHTLLFVAMLVVSIYLHELGHAWGNKVQGVPVRRIVLHGGGGFCESARSASATQQEFIVMMGPLVNLALWALGSLGYYFLMDFALSEARSAADISRAMQSGVPTLAYYLHLFGLLNLALFAFNLIPVQPLDGGKLFQLALLRVVPPGVAMKTAGYVGLVFAVLWWPALFLLYTSTGWLLLFAPSIRQHLAMARGQLR